MNVNEFRKMMPVSARWAYFDHAAVAPLPDPVRQALVEWSTDMAENGAVDWVRWRKQIEKVRSQFADLLGAHEREIALIRNTTEGISLIAEGLDWRDGDNVVTVTGEFPSNYLAWKNLARLGVELRQVAVVDEQTDLTALEAACDEKTRIVTISWVGYATGWRNDLAALADLAHRRGALLFVDAIQGLGVLPLDVSEVPVDFLAADGHKWLLGPEGAGALYVREENLERLQPLVIGWNSVVTAGNFVDPDPRLKSSAARYEGGTYNMAGFAGLGASLDMFLDCGLEAISERLLEVTSRLCEKLASAGHSVASSREADRRSGIVAVDWPADDHAGVRRRCLENGVVVNIRGGRLRLSPHVFTNDDDIDRLLDVLAKS